MYVLSTSTSLLPVLTELRSLPPRTQAMFAVCDHVCDVCAVHLYISAPSPNGATQSSTAHPGYVCCMWSCMWCMCCPPLHLCSQSLNWATQSCMCLALFAPRLCLLYVIMYVMYVLSTSTSLLPVLTELRSLPLRAQAMFAVCDHVCDVCAVHLYISAPSPNGATQSSTAHPGYVCCMWSCMWCMCCPPLHLCSQSLNWATQSSPTHPGYVCCMWSCMWCMCCPPLHLCSQSLNWATQSSLFAPRLCLLYVIMYVMYVLSTSTSLLPVLTELRSLPLRAQAMFAVCDHVCDVCAVHLYISAPSPNGATQSSTSRPGYVCCMWSCMWCMCCPPLHLCSQSLNGATQSSTSRPGYVCCMWSCMWCMCCPPLHLCSQS